MKKVLPYLKYIVPIACILSVTIVVFMAMKVSDLKNQRDDKKTEYNTAAEEFFGENLVPENNNVENEASENEIEEDEEDDDDEKKQPFITTYDINEIDEQIKENEVEEETVDTSEKKDEARNLIVRLLGEDDFTITYKEISEEGHYIFEVKDNENEEVTLKSVNLEEKSVQTITSE